MNDPVFSISNSAATEIQRKKSQDEATDLALRITVLGGGCSGFQYDIGYDTHRFDDDIEFKNGDAVVIIDEISVEYIKGSILDYEQDFMGSRFVIKNPNATSTCGCGTSFGM